MTSSAENTAPAPNKWGAMLAVGLGVFMATLDVSIINVSLPTLVEDLETSFAAVQWVILSYVLVLTSAVLSVARMGDLWGKKKFYTWGLVVFTAGSLLCGLAPSIGWLIAFRFVQGIGAVMTQALGAAIVTEVFPASERGRAMGAIGSTVSVGLAVGPALGGLLIGLIGWRSVFLVNVPIGVVAVWACRKFIPTYKPRPDGKRFDLAGAGIMAAVLVCYALGMTLGQRQGFDHQPTLMLLGGACLGLIAFIMVEKKVPGPIIDMGLFKNYFFTLNLVMGFMVFIVIAGTFVIPFYLQLVKGYPTQKVGLLMMVVPVSMGLISPPAGALSDRFGSRGISLLGLAVVLVGCEAIAGLNRQTTELGYIMRLLPFGIGMGLFQSPNNSAIMGGVPRARLGMASGLLTLTRTMGHTSGIPLAGALFSMYVLAAAGMDASAKVVSAPPEALATGIFGVYRIMSLVIVGACVLAALAWRLDRKQAREGPSEVASRPETSKTGD